MRGGLGHGYAARMKSIILSVLAVGWPVVASWLVLKLFPGVLTKFITKEVDRRSDAKLERLKADLQGAYSTLKNSVDVITATNAGMHPHIVASVTGLWAHMLLIRDRFGTSVGFDSTFTAEEAGLAFRGTDHPNLLEYVRAFECDMFANPLFTELNGNEMDRHRLFSGDRLWLIFHIFRAVHLRYGYLLTQSFERRDFVDWRKDNGIGQLLGSVLSKSDVSSVRAMDLGGLVAATSRLEADFLHEATRVMSGSKAMADSLSDMHSILLLQNAKIGKGT